MISGARPPEQICGHADSTRGDFPVGGVHFLLQRFQHNNEIKAFVKEKPQENSLGILQTQPPGDFHGGPSRKSLVSRRGG